MLTRVAFREGQVLHAADLNDQSAYLRSLRRRHDAGAHGWGIVGGLALEREPGGFVVGAGLAWDGFGRTLLLADEVFRPWRLREGGSVTDLFTRLEAPGVDVWLLYDHQPQSAAGHCPDRQPTRWRETARLCYTPVLEFPERPDFDPRRPWGLSPADLHYGPHLEPASDPARLWPVYLGTLYLDGDDPQVDTARRPYAGLVGQRVLSASRQALPEEEDAESAPPPAPRVELLLDGERSLPQPRRFVVRVRDETGQMVERLAAERPGRVVMRGHVILLTAEPVGDRQEASDWILAQPDPAFGPEDVCNPDAVACRLAEFEVGETPAEQALLLLQETAPAAEQMQIALLGLNSLLVQPQLYTQPALARATLRPETAALLSTTRRLHGSSDRPRYSRRAAAEFGVSAVANDVVRRLLEQSLEPRLLQDDALRALLEQGQVRALLRIDDVRQPFQQFTTRLVSQQIQEADRAQVALNRQLLEDFYGQALCRRGRLHAYTLGFAPLAQPPAEAQAWSVYRTDVPASEETGQPQQRQLRLEFGEFGEPQRPERSQFAVGYYDSDEAAFHPCLSVDEACTLHLSGNLTVEGDLIRRPPAPTAGDAPGTGGAAGVSQPSLEEALAQQPVALSTLDVAIQDVDAKAGDIWSYNVSLENTGQETVRLVLVVETFNVDGGTASETRVAGGLERLEVGESATVPVTHLHPLPDPAAEVGIQLTVLAYTPDSRVMYQSEKLEAPVTP